MWLYTPLIPTLIRGGWVLCNFQLNQIHLVRSFLDSQSYIMRPCLKRQINKQILYPEYGNGTHFWSQHLWGRGRWVLEFKASLVYTVLGQPGVHKENLPQNRTKQNFILLLCIWVFVLHVGLCTICMVGAYGEGAVRCPGQELQSESLCRRYKSNLNPLEEQLLV